MSYIYCRLLYTLFDKVFSLRDTRGCSLGISTINCLSTRTGPYDIIHMESIFEYIKQVCVLFIMENVLLYIFVNFNLTIVFRMLQGVSPLKIRLDRIRNYDPPYATTLFICLLFGYFAYRDLFYLRWSPYREFNTF